MLTPFYYHCMYSVFTKIFPEIEQLTTLCFYSLYHCFYFVCVVTLHYSFSYSLYGGTPWTHCTFWILLVMTLTPVLHDWTPVITVGRYSFTAWHNTVLHCQVLFSHFNNSYNFVFKQSSAFLNSMKYNLETYSALSSCLNKQPFSCACVYTLPVLLTLI